MQRVESAQPILDFGQNSFFCASLPLVDCDLSVSFTRYFAQCQRVPKVSLTYRLQLKLLLYAYSAYFSSCKG